MPREANQLSDQRSKIAIVCGACGGYGVTVYPSQDPDSADVGYKKTCADCVGTGVTYAESLDTWRADPSVLEMLANYPLALDEEER